MMGSRIQYVPTCDLGEHAPFVQAFKSLGIITQMRIAPHPLVRQLHDDDKGARGRLSLLLLLLSPLLACGGVWVEEVAQ